LSPDCMRWTQQCPCSQPQHRASALIEEAPQTVSGPSFLVFFRLNGAAETDISACACPVPRTGGAVNVILLSICRAGGR
jgi:hypothetical protein